MPKPELVLSNTTTFFSGRLENLFKKAKEFGFHYLEIIPYRWSRPQAVLALQNKYRIKIAGIHLPLSWHTNLTSELLAPLFHLLLGNAAESPGLALAKALQNDPPYLLIHANIMTDLGPKLSELAREFHLAIENVPYRPAYPRHFWDPAALRDFLNNQKISAQIIFDPGHFLQSRAKLPELNIFRTYQTARPEIVHISYDTNGIHTLPDEKEQKELLAILKLHAPRYVVIETSPWVDLRKAKKLFDDLLSIP